MLTWEERASGPPTRAGTPPPALAAGRRWRCCWPRDRRRPPPPAAAGPGAECPPGQTDCSVWDDDPGIPGEPGRRRRSGRRRTAAVAAAKCQWNGGPMPCYDDDPRLVQQRRRLLLQAGRAAAEAARGQQWYVQTCNGGDLGDQTWCCWTGRRPGSAPRPTRRSWPAGRSPRSACCRPGSRSPPGAARAPAWSACRSGCGPAPARATSARSRASASDRGLTVDITAKVDRIVWDMGNGKQGHLHRRRHPVHGDRSARRADLPDCGYDNGYPKAGTYRVSATTHWTRALGRGGGAERRHPADPDQRHRPDPDQRTPGGDPMSRSATDANRDRAGGRAGRPAQGGPAAAGPTRPARAGRAADRARRARRGLRGHLGPGHRQLPGGGPAGRGGPRAHRRRPGHACRSPAARGCARCRRSRLDEVVGKRAAVSLVPGTLLTLAQLTDDPLLGPGQQQIALGLKPQPGAGPQAAPR